MFVIYVLILIGFGSIFLDMTSDTTIEYIIQASWKRDDEKTAHYGFLIELKNGEWIKLEDKKYGELIKNKLFEN